MLTVMSSFHQFTSPNTNILNIPNRLGQKDKLVCGFGNLNGDSVCPECCCYQRIISVCISHSVGHSNLDFHADNNKRPDEPLTWHGWIEKFPILRNRLPGRELEQSFLLQV